MNIVKLVTNPASLPHRAAHPGDVIIVKVDGSDRPDYINVTQGYESSCSQAWADRQKNV